jgi:hypothetical protein
VPCLYCLGLGLPASCSVSCGKPINEVLALGPIADGRLEDCDRLRWSVSA